MCCVDRIVFVGGCFDYCYVCRVVLFCLFCYVFIFFFKQKTAYEMRISDWSSDVCSSDLLLLAERSVVEGYRVEGPIIFDVHLLPLIGCLLLARLDSDSPVDYLSELNISGVRRIAKTLLRGDTLFANRWFN